jgi:hypothetical protein
VVRRRRFFFAAKIAFASSVASGAITTSVKISTIGFGGFGVENLVQRDDPPEGRGAVAVEGAGIGLGQGLAPRATPQGLACLMIAQTGPSSGWNSATSSNAASVSLMLL